MRRAVFVDRDGTLVEEAGYIRSPRDMRLLPRAGRALAALRRRGFRVVLVTNQSAVARGLLSEARLAAIHAELNRRLRRHGAVLDGIYVCPHHPTAGRLPYRRRCRCRKPAAGLILRAAQDLGIDRARSFSVGDSLRDVQSARRAGVKPILVRTGHGSREEPEVRRRYPECAVAADLAAAARFIGRGGGRP